MDKALDRELVKVPATVQDKVLGMALDRKLVKVLALVQAMVPVKVLAAMELAKNRALHIILINSTMKINMLHCLVPLVPSQNSPGTPVGLRVDLVVHLAKLASVKAKSRVSAKAQSRVSAEAQSRVSELQVPA